MPGTAKLRGLENSFNVVEALEKSAAYLAELNTRFGNYGLAAAAYNAGEAGLRTFIDKGGFPPRPAIMSSQSRAIPSKPGKKCRPSALLPLSMIIGLFLKPVSGSQ